MYDISEIEPGLFTGGGYANMPPVNIQVVVNLSTVPDVFTYKITQLAPWFKVMLWVPIDDGVFPGTPWLDYLVRSIDQFRSLGWNVFIHCAAGISRSAFLTAAYLMFKHGRGRSAALKMVANKRPEINPAAVYLEALKQYEHVLRGS